MIQSLIIHTSSGLPVFSWNWQGIMDKSSTHEYLVTGVISAIESLIKTVFMSRLQRIELETGLLVITGEEFSYENKKGEISTQLLIVSAFADGQDNNNLVDTIARDILHETGLRYQHQSSPIVKDLDISPWLENYLEKKTRSRTLQKTVLAGGLALVSFLVATLFFSINFAIWFPDDLKGFLQVLVGLGTAFVLLTMSAFLAGKREYGVIIAVAASAIGAFIGDYLISELISSPYFDSGVGTFVVYFAISILIALIAGYTGGFLAERTYLFPAKADS